MLLYLIVAVVHFASHYINQYGNTDYPYNIVVSTEMLFHTGLFILFKYCKSKATPWLTYQPAEKVVVTLGLLAWLDGVWLLFSYTMEHRYFHLALGTLATYGVWYAFMLNIASLRKYALAISVSFTVLHAIVGLTSILHWLDIISMFHHIDAVSYIFFYVVNAYPAIKHMK
jgi:hypothetical protein